MPRSPLTETYEKVNDIFQTINALEPDQRNLLLDWLFPEPEPAKKPQKKSSKKPAGKGEGGKSKHASSLQQQIQTARPTLDGGVSKMRCSREGCGEYADHNKHHLTTDPDYHEFVAPPAAHAGKSDAQSAAGGS